MGLTASKPLTTPSTVHYSALVASLPRLDGKTIAITGCTSGTGLVCAKTCAELGAKVLMLNRPSERASAALQIMQDAGFDAVHIPCDLQSFEGVRQAAKDLACISSNGIDVLCNNAGVMGIPDAATKDGYCVQMQSNHLSHFLLTAEVWPLLEKAATLRGDARVVNHSSGARKSPAGPLQAEYFAANGGNLGGDWWPLAKWRRYQQSKLANLLFTYALSDRCAQHGSKVKVLCAHPGATLTNLQVKTAQSGGTSLLDYYILNSTMKKAHSEEDGTQGIALCCAAADVENGQFYGPENSTGLAVLLPAERDVDGEKMLWEQSVKATGAKYFV
ncbi:hypothetical protein CYMTET_11636 [Cymbomonas tetramitiformis]|uniref:Uncharacterized protein n=1 Tax=Cymbomonas tetramitiformis TaxID=36881 RepID=A0AAE0GLN1_9CHLO|nr:hypothetical protein CYMTET_11636 [Cymbomonas tetramitiformis]|eukprot:gene20819-24953_t